ncbi:MAG: DUF3293 domain-containing protein [Gemmatimonadaceae bacterium]
MLHFETIPPRTIDLREAIGSTSRKFFKEIGFEQSFGLVSAQNPMGSLQTATENERLAASLHQELAASGLTHARVNACSPDGSHCEKSVAIALNMQSVIDLADRYRQLATFWFDGEVFWIIPVRSILPKVRLPTIA